MGDWLYEWISVWSASILRTKVKEQMENFVLLAVMFSLVLLSQLFATGKCFSDSCSLSNSQMQMTWTVPPGVQIKMTLSSLQSF